jgi:type VI secretion system VasD/TssJ family lipoprotein
LFDRAKSLLLAGFLALLTACSSAPTELSVEEDKWTYEVRAINLLLRATADVNSVSGRPHSIVVGLFQMNNPGTFDGLSVTREGAVELLQKGKIDETIVGFQLVTMRPGEQKSVSISRAESAKFIGVITGYFKLNPKTDVKIFPIPVREVERGVVEKSLAWASLVSDTAKAVPGKLNVVVDLGRTGSRRIVAIEDEIFRETRTKTVTTEKSTADESWFGNLKDNVDPSDIPTDD